jgi:hypothetical protein
LLDVRHAERPADLDQLAAGDQDLLVPGQGAQREHDRRGVVVDHDEAVAGEQPPHQRVQVGQAAPAAARFHVVLEVEVAPGGLGHPVGRARGEHRASEVRVHDDPGRVDHGPRRRSQQVGGRRPDPAREARGGHGSSELRGIDPPGPGGLPQLGQPLPQQVGDERRPEVAFQDPDRPRGEQPRDGRNSPRRGRILAGLAGPFPLGPGLH